MARPDDTVRIRYGYGVDEDDGRRERITEVPLARDHPPRDTGFSVSPRDISSSPRAQCERGDVARNRLKIFARIAYLCRLIISEVFLSRQRVIDATITRVIMIRSLQLILSLINGINFKFVAN